MLLSFIYPQILRKSLKDNQTGSAAGGIKASKLKRIEIPLPPLSEQKRIVSKVNDLMNLCDDLKAKINDAQSSQIQLADVVEKAVA